MTSAADIGRDVVLLGGSAGGVTALRQITAALPADLAACVLVVLHLPRSGGSSTLPAILNRECPLPVRVARDGDPLTPGTVLVAPVERHLLVRDGRVALTVGALENGQRPAVDPLFRSAAQDLGPRVVAVVLTGNLDDGSAGLRAVVRHGGAAVVQDPDDAAFPGMPRNAWAAVPEATVAPLAELPDLLTELVRGPRGLQIELSEDLRRQEDQEVRSALGFPLEFDPERQIGVPSPYSCPDCSGVLLAVTDGPMPRYRCRVGHAWSSNALSQRQEQGVETALWVALRALEERAALAHEVARSAARSGRGWSEQHFNRRAREAIRHAAVLRQLLIEDPASVEPAPADRPELAELPERVDLAPVLAEPAGQP